MSYQIANRYARALYEQNSNVQTLDKIYKDLNAISMCIDNSNELKEFISLHTLPKERQEHIITTMFKKKIDKLTLEYLMFLISKSRLNILPDICSAFEVLVLESKNIVKATIVTSVKLDAKQIKAIKQHLKNKIKKDILEEVKIDTNMIGGVKVRVDDEIYDYTLRAQLEDFRNNFIRTV